MATTLSGAFTAIADAIRAKDGSSAALTPDEMVTAIENIPTGDANENLEKFMEHTLTDLVYEGGTVHGYMAYGNTGLKTIYLPNATSFEANGYTFNGCTNLEWFYAPAVTQYMGAASSSTGAMFTGCSSLKYLLLPNANAQYIGSTGGSVRVLDIGKAYGVASTNGSYPGVSDALIIRTTNGVPTLTNRNYMPGLSADAKIYVPDALVAQYKVATNWTSYADRITPLSELPQWILDLYDDHYDWTQEET